MLPQPQPPELLSELPDTSFNMWKRHPITQLLFRYCEDVKRGMLAGHLDRWQTGNQMKDGGEDEARGAARILGEIVTLELAHIRQFYDVEAPQQRQ